MTVVRTTPSYETSYETVIGLEVHVQLATRAKLFSSAAHAFGGEPNTRVDAFDLGLPGVLPRANEAALRLALLAALALEGEVQERSRFVRKNYFYPDLPKGYQISQHEEPYCLGGRVPLESDEQGPDEQDPDAQDPDAQGRQRYGQLLRIHLEEDAGKSVHTEGGSLVDLNRAGCALIEIVGLPDLHAPADAHAFLTNLKQILQYAGVSDCDMEKGSLRCDANISLRPEGTSALGTKVEVKNLNSFKMVQRALEYEERRQRALLAAGAEVEQETRLYNEEKGETVTMRKKESAHDYRYFPEPDLPELHVPLALVSELRQSLPELPGARRQRWQRVYGLPRHDASVLLGERPLADYFEAVAAAGGDAKAASNWVMTEVLRWLHEEKLQISGFPLEPGQLAGLIRAQVKGLVSRNAAKKVFLHMLETGHEAEAAIEALGLQQITDPGELAALVGQVLLENPKPVADYRAGKKKALHALKGLVMQASRGKAKPQLLDQLLVELLAEEPPGPPTT